MTRHAAGEDRVVSVKSVELVEHHDRSSDVETASRWSEHYCETERASFWCDEITGVTTWDNPAKKGLSGGGRVVDEVRFSFFVVSND